MDYEFRRDFTGQVVAKLSMGHEAIACWLNDEVGGDISFIDNIMTVLLDNSRSGGDWCLVGREYSLWLDAEEVTVRANQLDFSHEDLEEGMFYYDEESLASCGLEDFIYMMNAYKQFCTQYQ